MEVVQSYQFDDILRALRENPEWLEELRALVFTEELLALPAVVRTHSQILERLTSTTDQNTATLDQHTATLDQHGEQLTRIQAQLERIEIRLDETSGYITEERYRNKAYAYFGAIARRIRPLRGPDLDDVLDPVEATGRLDERDRLKLLAADGIFDGRRDGEPVRLVLEASVLVDPTDVTRAADRARILARADVPTLAIAAGKRATPAARQAARRSGVWIVTNGRPEAPETFAPDLA